MPKSPRMFGFALTMLFAGSLVAAAQEESPKKGEDAKKSATEESVAKDTESGNSVTAIYLEQHREWDALNEQIDTAKNELLTAKDKEKEASKNHYSELVIQANALLPQLRSSAMAAYQEKPNEDKQLLRLLIGIAANDARRDRYEEAYELAQLLIEKECGVSYVDCIAGACAWSLHEFDNVKTHLQRAAGESGKVPHGVGEYHNADRLTTYLQQADEYKKLWEAEQAIRAKEKEAGDLPRVLLTTNQGEILIELFENEAPQTVGNFVNLVESGFYDGLTFHRVLGGFMAQGGCPLGTGIGGPGYNIFCECDPDKFPRHRRHFRGTLSMAHGKLSDTGGSQFFLTFSPTLTLNGVHTAFGRVISDTGLQVLSKIKRRNPTDEFDQPIPADRLPAPDKILKAEVVEGTKRDHEYKPTIVPGSEESSSSDSDSEKEDGDKDGEDKESKKKKSDDEEDESKDN